MINGSEGTVYLGPLLVASASTRIVLRTFDNTYIIVAPEPIPTTLLPNLAALLFSELPVPACPISIIVPEASSSPL